MQPHVTVFGITPNLSRIVEKSFKAVSIRPALPHASIAAVQAPTSLYSAYGGFLSFPLIPLWTILPSSSFCRSIIRSPLRAKSLLWHRPQTSIRAQYVIPLG